MDERLLISEFLDQLGERAESLPRGRCHQAFLDWYIEAEFGQVKWNFTDDVNDGGIDAVVWRPNETPPVLIIQSKFSEHVGRGQIAQSAYTAFQTVVDAFHNGDSDFEEFLGKVRDDLKGLYRKAFERLRDNNWHQAKKAFVLITTMTRRAASEFNTIPKQNFVYAGDVLRLYWQYRKGATPKARPLELTIEDKLSYRDARRKVTSYLFNARLSDFRKYLEENDVSRLVARNIRYNLGGRVGRAIRSTYEKTPHNFWYLHNGLTIVCDDFIEKDQVATVINPSVINGAQTLYALNNSASRKSQALVTTRVIVRGAQRDGAMEDDEWLQGVIRGVNTQNRVHAYDFRSNEPEQMELQKNFREAKIFYERKRGEWREFRNEPRFKGFDRVSLVQLGQILTVTSDGTGQGVLLAKRGTEGIFDEKHYRKLFPSRSKVAYRFRKMYLAYRLYRLVYRFAYTNQKESRRRHHAFWNILWILHSCVTSVPGITSHVTLQGMREAFDSLESTGAPGRRARKLLRQAQRAVWSAWRQGRKADVERWTANNFFKSRYGNRKVLSLAVPKVRNALRSLGRYIITREFA